MYDYHVDLVWKADGIFLGVCVFFSILIVIHGAWAEVFLSRRRRNLGLLKRNLEEIALLGKDACSFLVQKFSPVQLMDIVKNRDQVLPREFERQFRDCLVSQGKIADIEKIAQGAGNKWQRIQALICLAYEPSPAALEILKKSVFHRDEDISYFSLLALGHIKNVPSAKILIDLLGKGIFSCNKIVSLLESFPPEITGEVIKATEDRDATVRFWAVKLLSRFKTKQYLKSIQRLTKDAAGDVRAASCECLGKMGDREARGVLWTCLKDEVWFVRMHAVRALSEILGGECIPEVVGLLKDDAWLVRDSVKKAMTRHVDPSLHYILQSLRSGDRTSRKDCIEVLEDSGCLIALFEDIFSQDPSIKIKAMLLLEALIRSGEHFGLESILAGLKEDERQEISKIIAAMDQPHNENLI